MGHDPKLAQLLDEVQRLKLSRRSVLRRAAALGVTGSALATALAAAPAPARAQSKTRIRLATWAGADEANELQGVIDKVNQEATNFEIVSEPTPADYYVKLQTTIAGGTAADLFRLSQEYIAGYAD